MYNITSSDWVVVDDVSIYEDVICLIITIPEPPSPPTLPSPSHFPPPPPPPVWGNPFVADISVVPSYPPLPPPPNNPFPPFPYPGFPAL